MVTKYDDPLNHISSFVLAIDVAIAVTFASLAKI